MRLCSFHIDDWIESKCPPSLSRTQLPTPTNHLAIALRDDASMRHDDLFSPCTVIALMLVIMSIFRPCAFPSRWFPVYASRPQRPDQNRVHAVSLAGPVSMQFSSVNPPSVVAVAIVTAANHCRENLTVHNWD
ncbi:hypothetical protein LX32DRAFT_323789 [Colletotrichum zoysiae]|uniref:Uncharacterized protein n=1 Tax=Colletotrichum zoysiae TaxID=1216348 RepID=A0AAD9HLQ5_9PEZI|nr:hypothetical protein LX32DRAFT_323789 [Colletotrichum zoysiae]